MILPRFLRAVSAGVALAAVSLLNCSESRAQFTPFWFDGFDVSAFTNDINFEIGNPRQGGVLVPTTYSTTEAIDYHTQMFGGVAPLQLAADAFGNSPTVTMVSPNLDLSGTAGGQVIGRKISVFMDAFTNNIGGTYFTTSAITVGSSSVLADADTKADGFSVVFVEDTFGGFGNFIQFWDGNSIVGNLIPNPAGVGGGNVEIFADDPVDGNPFDGIGDTRIDVLVNGVNVGGYTKLGGYSSNFITLQGDWESFTGLNPGPGLVNGLATHVFDNLTVFTIPEPASVALVGLGLCGLAVRRKR